jgi:hypothetical protein
VRIGTGELHLIVDSTGLKLRGAGEWLFEKHGTTKRRAWRKLHIGIDAGNSEIVAFDLTDKDVDDASHVPTLLDQPDEPNRVCDIHSNSMIEAASTSRHASQSLHATRSKDAALLKAGVEVDADSLGVRPFRQSLRIGNQTPWHVVFDIIVYY